MEELGPSTLLARIRHSRIVGVARYHAYRDLLLAFPRRHQCNICGWRGRRFLTYLHRFVLCPKCGSQIRHRLIAAALALDDIARRTHLPQARVLHISPEYCLSLVFKPHVRHYVAADWATKDAAVRQDMRKMPFADGTFDIVIACDVLEHIVDDDLAVRECRRVMRRGGTAILTVPQSDHDVATFEDPTITTAEGRAEAYGQPDHVRNYGTDFAQRIATAGFRVRSIDSASFAPGLAARHVLAPPVPLDARWGWNFRRVLFAEAVD